MRNMKDIQERYSVEQIKGIFYSMIDSMYDLAFNYDMTVHDLNGTSKWASDTIYEKKSVDAITIDGILTQMSRDMIAMFGNFNSDLRDFLKAFIDRFYYRGLYAMSEYIGGPFIKGRMHPDTIATNGTGKAYLFLHKRHPKCNFNMHSKELAEKTAKEIFEKTFEEKDNGILGEELGMTNQEQKDQLLI